MANSRGRYRRILRPTLFLCLFGNVNSFTLSPTKVSTKRQGPVCRLILNGNDDKREIENDRAPTMSTALCVVPPDEAWDTIQRARHLARDRTYRKWPPAIRLFHPFCPRAQLSNYALEIARIVEEYDIEPFTVSLDSWTIVPHMEAIEADWDAMKQLPTQEKVVAVEEEETEADRLIAEVERQGKENRGKRRRWNKKPTANDDDSGSSSEEQTSKKKEDVMSKKESPRELLDKQKRMYEEFNGPCVLCLEPDEESRERLAQLRELLKEELFGDYDKFSPSSSVSTTNKLPRAVLEAKESSFRPLVPVGNFPTVTSAVEMARKLKGLWDPLPFNVTDFHLISYENEASSREEVDEFSGNAQFNLKKMTSWRHVDIEEETLTTQGQFGCDALVMLMGEEVDTDQEDSKEMVEIIMRQGSPGGYELAMEGEEDEEMSSDKLFSSSEETSSVGEDDEDTGDLELWLNDDDQVDDGTVIVIGRSHFFTGEMRTYNGMPATSVMDAKDRVLGAGVHASARRKSSPKRASNVWMEGEYGYRESDFTL